MVNNSSRPALSPRAPKTYRQIGIFDQTEKNFKSQRKTAVEYNNFSATLNDRIKGAYFAT